MAMIRRRAAGRPRARSSAGALNNRAVVQPAIPQSPLSAASERNPDRVNDMGYQYLVEHPIDAGLSAFSNR